MGDSPYLCQCTEGQPMLVVFLSLFERIGRVSNWEGFEVEGASLLNGTPGIFAGNTQNVSAKLTLLT